MNKPCRFVIYFAILYLVILNSSVMDTFSSLTARPFGCIERRLATCQLSFLLHLLPIYLDGREGLHFMAGQAYKFVLFFTQTCGMYTLLNYLLGNSSESEKLKDTSLPFPAIFPLWFLRKLTPAGVI